MIKNKIILGDNVFWGVNHHNKELGDILSEKFKEPDAIVSIIEQALENGIEHFMFSSHERVENILNECQKNDLLKHISILPNIPYIIKYVKKASQDGLPSLINSYVPNDSFFKKIIFLFQSGRDIALARLNRIIESAIDKELSVYKGFNLPIIFLHNAITDLIIGLGAIDALEVYCDHIRSKYNSMPGFITLNPIILNKSLKIKKIENVCLMSPFNNSGFNMNPSVEKVEQVIEKLDYHFIPMNIFASSAKNPEKSIKYISRFKKISNIIIGTSNPIHIKQNKFYFDKYFLNV